MNTINYYYYYKKKKNEYNKVILYKNLNFKVIFSYCIHLNLYAKIHLLYI